MPGGATRSVERHAYRQASQMRPAVVASSYRLVSRGDRSAVDFWRNVVRDRAQIARVASVGAAMQALCRLFEPSSMRRIADPERSPFTSVPLPSPSK